MIEVTPRQLELLALYASGFTMLEISQAKFVSVRAVEQSFALARKRNDAKSLTNLCVMAVDAGLIVRNGTGYKPVVDPEIVGE